MINRLIVQRILTLTLSLLLLNILGWTLLCQFNFIIYTSLVLFVSLICESLIYLLFYSLFFQTFLHVNLLTSYFFIFLGYFKEENAGPGSEKYDGWHGVRPTI